MGITFFMTELGWRIPVWTMLTPDFQVPILKFQKRDLRLGLKSTALQHNSNKQWKHDGRKKIS